MLGLPKNWQGVQVTTAPQAPKRPHEITQHGDTRIDPYYWLMDQSNPEVLEHLRAENAFFEQELAPLSPKVDKIYDEFIARVAETDISLPTLNRGWWYYSRTKKGLSYSILCRVANTPGNTTPPEIDAEAPYPGEQVLLDENIEAEGHDFFSVGVFGLSLDDKWLAVGVDFEGSELHTVKFRPLLGQEEIADVIEDVYYGFAWSKDSKYFFYTRTDDAMRPFQVWRHELGTDANNDALVYQEDDPKFSLSIGLSHDEHVIIVQIGSSTTTEVRYIDASEPLSEMIIVEPRVTGIELGIDHFSQKNGQRWWLKATNEDAEDFRLLARHFESGEWREILAHRPGTHIDDFDVFQGYLVVSERLNGSTVLRTIAFLDEEDPFGSDFVERSRVITGDVTPGTIGSGGSVDYVTETIRIIVTSLITPSYVADLTLATGDIKVLKQQKVLGDFSPDNYVTGRLWVSASDGARIPVSVCAHKDFVTVNDDGTITPKTPSPLVLYGYGSYEACMDPYFSVLRLSLLNRGVIYAIAHVRGGGEMGRAWYLQGKLAQKPTTFSDFVAVARHFVDTNWTSPNQLLAWGGSAGGLLMGAVVNLAPELFKAVIAAVPFVDSLTTMLNPELPLTVNEYEEWGNPTESATAYRTIKSYSPYDNVRSTNEDGSPRVYPHMFVQGGLNDVRVGFWEPAKWVLKLRDANPQNYCVLKTELDAGHAGPSARYQAWRDDCQMFTWIMYEIAPATL